MDQTADSSSSGTQPQPSAPQHDPPSEVAAAPALKPVWLGFWVGAVVLPAIGLGTFYLLRRRMDPKPGTSLITQSFDREKRE